MIHSKITKPNVVVLSGYGLNCEDETAFAFNSAGAKSDIVHINDLISNKNILKKYQILVVPGGFSFGDDTGSGKAYANKLKANLGFELQKFILRDTLMIGICNGFQILTSAGILPGALTFNDNNRYTARWVDVKFEGKSPWFGENGMEISLPIAHGEGKYWHDTENMGVVAGKYVRGDISKNFDLPYNPNGSVDDIASIMGYDGRVVGMMPHPERAQFFYQLPHWSLLNDRLRRSGETHPKEGPGLQIFKNAVRYFK